MWLAYAYRDLLPLATYDGAPVDAAEGNILWAKIVLLTFAAVIFPLVSPRHPHIVSEGTTPSPEQTASILSLVTFSWLDPLIADAQKKRRLPVEDMPPLAHYNSIDHLVDISYAVRF